MAWNKGRPEQHGYYLGAWLRRGRWQVSELWYNPDSLGSGWWETRGYLGQVFGSSETVDVVAWMQIPDYDPAKEGHVVDTDAAPIDSPPGDAQRLHP
jgi:hypothetical protein